MSPELFDPEIQTHQRTEYSDCYALGMVIYEVLSRYIPFYRSMNIVVSGKVLKGERPERPRGPEGVAWFTDDVWEVLKLCWASLPQDRPGVGEVLKFMEKIASSWTPSPSPSTAVPSPTSSVTSIIVDTTKERVVDVDGRKAPSSSHPLDELPQKDDAGDSSTHPPTREFAALLHDTPDHQDFGADVMVPGAFPLSTPPPAWEKDHPRPQPSQSHR